MFGTAVIIALIIIVIVIVIIKRREPAHIIPIKMSIPENAIVLRAGESTQISPKIMLRYTEKGDVCLSYTTAGTTNLCEPLYPVRDGSKDHFVVLDSSLAFNSYVGNPFGQFKMTGIRGFSLSYLADKLSSWIARDHPTESKAAIENDIISSFRQRVGENIAVSESVTA